MACLKSHYYHYTRPNDKLSSLKRSFSRAKQQIAGCQWNLQAAICFHVKQSQINYMPSKSHVILLLGPFIPEKIIRGLHKTRREPFIRVQLT